MGEREAILDALRRNRPEPTPLPDIYVAEEKADLAARFAGVVEEIGGKVVETSRENVEAALRKVYPDLEPAFASGLENLDGPASLALLDLFVFEGVFGVAENGAIWAPERVMGMRIAPFITQHVGVILDRTQIVQDMHAAYARADIGVEGFGVFIAGPSKTADIEQSLILGAHGPRSLTVLLV
jgi:L-lactate dehydrogenase complex protein LldG